jgi:hypothetical protein
MLYFKTGNVVGNAMGTVGPLTALKTIVAPGLGPRGIATLGVGGTLASGVVSFGLGIAATNVALWGGIRIGSACDAFGYALASQF